MNIYKLYLDSGPMMKKTLIQVPDLAGCIARGDTSQEAIEAAPDAIRAYLRFLARHGEDVDPDAPFKTRVAEHVTSSAFPGMGLTFVPEDARRMPPREADALMHRLGALHQELRALVGGLPATHLDARPAKGRPIREILRHMCAEGGYLRGVSGASRIGRLVERGEVDALDALDELYVLEVERLRTMPPDERNGIVMRGQQQWTARSAVRRMLEHGWEHYAEISDRLGKAL